MDAPCCLIQDLLPCYLEGACSPETEDVIASHLMQCHNCSRCFRKLQKEDAQFRQQISRLEKWGILWILKECFDGLRLNSRMLLKWAAILAAVCLVLAAGHEAWQGLTQVDSIPVSSQDYQVNKVMQLRDGNIFCGYSVRYHSTFTHHYVITDDCVYFPALRPVLDRTYSAFGEHSGGWIMNPNSVWNEHTQQYIPVNAIYLGNPEDSILIWRRGMDLPIASSEEQAWVDSADRTIY